MSFGKFHAMHGRDHGPRSADPSYTEQWHYVGDPGEPAFQNGWTNIGGTYGRTCFRLSVGPPGKTLGGTYTPNAKQSLEIILAVTGGATGSVIFTLPPGYFDFADKGLYVPGHAHRSDGTYAPYHINGATGDVVDGV
jgi:hypothetical protein